jgi:hypothetical protein
MATLSMHSGTMSVKKNRQGIPKYHCQSIDGQKLECWSLEGARFWLGLRENIVLSREQRKQRIVD